MNFTTSGLAPALSSLICFAIAIDTLRKRTIRGASAFGYLMIAGGVYTFGYSMELMSNQMPVMLNWIKLEYVGVSCITSIWLLTTLRYLGLDEPIRKFVPTLFIIPGVTLLMVVTNDSHHLFYQRTWVDQAFLVPILAFTRGPFYYVHSFYSLITVLAGLAVLGGQLPRASQLFRNQLLILMVGSGLPLLVYLLYISGILPEQIDGTALILPISGIIYGWGLRRFHLFKLLPVARDVLVERMPDGLVVVDERGSIADINPAIEDILVRPRAQILGKPAREVFGAWIDLSGSRALNQSWEAEVQFRQKSFRMICTVMVDQAKAYQGGLLILADISRLKNNEIALRKNLARVEQLNALSRTLNQAFNLEEGVMFRMEAALQQVANLTGACMCRLYRVDSDELVMISSCNDLLFEQTGLVDTQSLGRAQQVFQDGSNITFLYQGTEKSATDQYILLSSGFQSGGVTSGRLQSNGLQPQGVLFLRVEDGQFSESEQKTIESMYEAVSLQLAAALENISLYQEVKHLAQTDDLTRLLTRRYGFQLGETAFRYANRYQQPMAVIMMDLDFFKKVNDSYGHAAGDQVLREVSDCIRACLRVTDQACRYGGDELLLIMPGADQNEACRVAERVRVEIEKLEFLLGDVGVHLTASMGVVGYVQQLDAQFNALVQRADQALYLAKQRGRNRVEVYEASDQIGPAAE